MTPQQAARELLRRRRGRASFADYAQSIEIPGKPATDDPEEWIFQPVESSVALHHRVILGGFQRTAARRHGRLMVFAPPGSAKSTYCSVVAPTALMGQIPGYKIILASYGQTLARKHGRRARQVVKQRAFEELWSGVNGNPAHVSISPHMAAADEWSLTNGSEYLACGILTGITGNRAHGLVIDDPIKGRAEADSPTIRDKTWEAYQDDLLTRLIPGGWIVFVTTRWHEDDPAGRILPKGYDGRSGMVECRDGKVWEVINIPAECEREDDPLGRKIGEMIWPEWFDADHWKIFRVVTRTWAALYQQRPQPGEGGIYKKGWIRRYRAPPLEGAIVQSWDTAYKPEQINDPSVCTTWLVTRWGYYLLHVWRDRVEYPELKRQVVALFLKWKPVGVLIEDKSSGQSLIQELRNPTRSHEDIIEGRRVVIPPIPIIARDPTEEGNKLVRAEAVSPSVEAGMVWLPESDVKVNGAEVIDWLTEYEGELFGFPLSATDDQVDSTSQFLRWVRTASISFQSHGLGNTRAGTRGYDDSPQDPRSQIDEDRGFGTVRSSTNLDGF